MGTERGHGRASRSAEYATGERGEVMDKGSARPYMLFRENDVCGLRHSVTLAKRNEMELEIHNRPKGADILLRFSERQSF